LPSTRIQRQIASQLNWIDFDWLESMVASAFQNRGFAVMIIEGVAHPGNCQITGTDDE
jgi:hypothetical protein